MSCLLPDLIYYQGRFHPGLALTIEDANIVSVAPPAPGQQVVRLPRQAILPGLVNAHSHAFQRAIRGRTEQRNPERPSDDFWSWRELMYQAAQSLSPEEIEAVSLLCYVEMVESGITTVGEFHYLHHQSDGTPYDDPDELAHRVLAAADQAGLACVMLRVAYARSGFEVEPNPRQARFIDGKVEDVLASLERLSSRATVGVVPHSVRAVDESWLRELSAYARQHRLPFHMHVCEQPKELEQCLAEHGATPIEFLGRLDAVDERFTGVHSIHLSEAEIALLGRAGATVCSCPTTERNLGDGIVPAARLAQAGVNFAFGSDSNCQIDLLEDARQLDYHERLARLQRAPLDPLGEVSLSQRLFDWATRGGARSLARNCGELNPGLPADFFTVDLDDPSVAGAGPDDLLATLVFGGEKKAVQNVWTGGRLTVSEGRHLQRDTAVKGFAKVMQRLRKT